MPFRRLNSPDAVLEALAEFDRLGRDPFLAKYGFRRALKYKVLHDGKEYDSKAIYGVACGYEDPEAGPLGTNDFSGGEQTAVKRLRELGFEVNAKDTGTPEDIAEGRLFIFTAAGRGPQENFRISLENGVPLTKLEPLSEVYSNLEKHAQAGRVFAWGARPGAAAEKTWERLQPGDWGLLYMGSNFPWAFEVLDKARSPEVARSIWKPGTDDAMWECIFFFHNKTQLDAPLGTVVEELGYASNFTPQGLAIPREPIQEQIRERYRSAKGFIDAIRSGERVPASRNGKGHWWVNQGKTFTTAAKGGYLWAPLESRKDHRSRDHWLRLRDAKPGDEVFHYADGAVRAVGAVREPARNAQQPAELSNGEWESAGLLLPVDYRVLDNPLGLNEIPARSRINQGAPFTSTGGVQQGYFYGLSDELAEELRRLIGGDDIGEETVGLRPVTESFRPAISDAGLSFSPEERLVEAFLAAVATKPFVILSGLSGSGKTQLALKLGQWLGSDQVLVTPVRPDWTGPEPLFGYEDALLEVDAQGRRAWHVPDPLRFALEAAANPEEPFLLVLDEMNLAHVERYFSDFLSGIESREPVLPNLERDHADFWRRVASGNRLIPIPRNLFVVGTVNVDETTYLFSPKVLDRANTFEFRVPTASLSKDAAPPGDIEAAPSDLRHALLELAADDEWQLRNPHPSQDQLVDELKRLHALLTQSGHEFGHRVFYESLRFAALFASTGDDRLNSALDHVVMQKVLPRLHGSRRRLEAPLRRLAAFTLSADPETDEGFELDPSDVTEGVQPRLPISFGKVSRMYERLRADQFASFAE